MAKIHIQDGSEEGRWVDEDASPVTDRNSLLAKYGLAVLGGNILSPSNLLYAPGDANYREPDYAGLYADPAFQADTAFANAVRPMTQQDRENFMNPDAPGNGAGKGSMKEGLLSAISFIVSAGATQIGASFGLDAITSKIASAAVTTAMGGSPVSAIISVAAPAVFGDAVHSLGMDEFAANAGVGQPALDAGGLINGGGVTYAAPAAFGGADFASGNIDVNGQALGDGASSFGNIDVNGQALGDGASSFGNIDVNGQALGDGASSFGNIDVNGQALGDVPAQAAPVDTSASLQNADGTWGSTAANSVAGGSGTVDPASSWLDNLKNLDPKLQAALAVAGGGLLSGALSGIGNYAATQSKIAADSALADKVSQNRIAEQAAIRNNNKVPGLLNLRPSAANAILRRADGTPYYKQG